MLSRLILLLGVGLALIHGYFYLSFGTLDPCKVAAFAMINQQTSEAGRALGQLVAGPIENRFRSKGMMNCYRAALLGEDPNALLQ